MSHSNVTHGMTHSDLNSEGKPYHEHGETVQKNKPHPDIDPAVQEPSQFHRHDNQYHKDIKGSLGSGSSLPGDRKADKSAQ